MNRVGRGDRKSQRRQDGQAKGQRGLRGEEGQAMLEMTICIIFLLLVVVALFEFALVFYSYI
ncbi:MAG: pilus assembly protein, partial [Anaerolineae bacterium]|nr:pilus assembly protein [Anaerolineae bacterium]